MRTDPSSFTLLLLAAFGLAACGQTDADDDAPSITPAPYPGCENEVYEQCDIADARCQAQVFSTIRCIRGDLDVDMPPSTTVTASEYREALVAAYAEVELAPYTAYEQGCILLGLAEEGQLMPSGQIDSVVGNIAAFYSDTTKSIVFVEPDGELPAYSSEYAHIILAHEYVHALQDREFDLAATREQFWTSTDNGLALKSLIEGEAQVLEDAYLAALWGVSQGELDYDSRYANLVADYQAYAAEDDSPLNAIWFWFPYARGAAYVYSLTADGGRDAIRAAFEEPPAASAAIYPGLTEEPVTEYPPVPPEGYELLDWDSFGAQLFTDFLRMSPRLPDGLAPTTATEVNTSWLGDAIYFYRNATDESVLVLWRLRLGDTALVSTLEQSFTAFYNDASPSAASVLENGDLLLVVANAEAALEPLQLLQGSAQNGDTMTADEVNSALGSIRPIPPPVRMR